MKTFSASLAPCEGNPPVTKASNVKPWCFLWCTSEQTAEQTVQILVIWDAIGLFMTSLFRDRPDEIGWSWITYLILLPNGNLRPLYSWTCDLFRLSMQFAQQETWGFCKASLVFPWQYMLSIWKHSPCWHYSDITWMLSGLDAKVRHNKRHGAMASRLLPQPFVQAHTKENESSASLTFLKGFHRWPVDFPHKG